MKQTFKYRLIKLAPPPGKTGKTKGIGIEYLDGLATPEQVAKNIRNFVKFKST